jgi:hypothetical protein
LRRGRVTAYRLLWGRRIRLPLTDADHEWARDCAAMLHGADRPGDLYDERCSSRWNSYEIELFGRTAEAGVIRYLGAEPDPPGLLRARRHDGGVDVPGWDVGVKCSIWRNGRHFDSFSGGRLIVPLRSHRGRADTYVLCVYLVAGRELYLAGWAPGSQLADAPRLTSNAGKPAVEVPYWQLWPPQTWEPRQLAAAPIG